MTPSALRRFALSLEGAVEQPHVDRASFRVRNRIFATMTPDGREAMVRVPVEEVGTFLDSAPDVFFSYGKWTTNSGMLGVRLADVDAGLMKELVRESWKRVAGASARKSAPTPARTRKR